MAVDTQFKGSLTLGAAVPTALTAQAAISASAGLALPELTAQLEGLGQVSAALAVGAPDLTATINAALDTVASLQAAISGPTVTLQASAVLDAIAEVQASLGALQAQLQLAADLGVQLGSAGVHLYTARGAPASQLGDALRSELIAHPVGGSGDSVGAVLLAAKAPSTLVQLGSFFGVALS